MKNGKTWAETNQRKTWAETNQRSTLAGQGFGSATVGAQLWQIMDLDQRRF